MILNPLDMDAMSPAIVGVLATIKVAFSQTLGEFGKGIQWFVFASGSVNPCVKGGMAVQFKTKSTPMSPPFPVVRRHSSLSIRVTAAGANRHLGLNHSPSASMPVESKIGVVRVSGLMRLEIRLHAAIDTGESCSAAKPRSK